MVSMKWDTAHTEDTEARRKTKSFYYPPGFRVLPCLSVGKNKKFNSDPFPYHAELELEIATLTNLGVGLARVPHPADPAARWVVMVPFVLPGERVRARVFRNHKNYSEADLVEVLSASPDRVDPLCPLFGRCGGCQYQNFTYAAGRRGRGTPPSHGRHRVPRLARHRLACRV